MNYYEEILKLNEAKDFARIIKKWEKLSENISAAKNVPMVLPDLLWITKSGVGKTHLLFLLSEYLSTKKNLVDFYGNVKYFEFMLDYCPPEHRFQEIERMDNEVSIAAGFRSVYRGIVSVDIDEWISHCEEKHFMTFLEYLSSNSNDWLIVFNVASENEEELKKLESVLLMFFRLEKATLRLPETQEFLQFIIERLRSYELTLDKSAQEMLFKTIEKLRENRYFDGYKTLVMLCQDIVYEYFSSKEGADNVISAVHLKEFAPDSEYIARATWKAESKRKIGY